MTAPLLQQAIELHQAGRLDEARRLCEAWLEREPGDLTGTYLLAGVHQQQGRLADAVPLFEKVIRRRSDFADAWLNLGACCSGLGQWSDAARCFERGTELAPAMPAAHFNLGVARQELERPSEALPCFERAIELAPAFVEAHFHRGLALSALGRLEEGLASFEGASSLRPGFAPAHEFRAGLLSRLGRLEAAVAAYERALACRVDASTLCNLADVLIRRGQPADALRRCDQAIALREPYPLAHNNRGCALNALNRPQEAVASFERALALAPDYAEAMNNLGSAFVRIGGFAEARSSFERALACKPELVEAQYNLAYEELRLGRFETGWARHESRWQQARGIAQYRHPQVSKWRGSESLENKRILLWAEQGFGDALQFCRYVPLLAARGAKVVLEVPHELKSLLARLSGLAEIHGVGEPIPPCDLQVPLLSLPLALGTDLDSIPASIPYISADPVRVQRWRDTVGRDAGARIGIACSGRASHRNDANRSLALKWFAPLYGRAQLYLLQKDVRDEDEEELHGAPIRDLRAELQSFEETAALMECLDLVISVDTAVVHLAGALGRPVWVLVSKSSDWRWMLERSDNPWYPSARVFRQEHLGDWSGPIANVAATLAALR